MEAVHGAAVKAIVARSANEVRPCMALAMPSSRRRTMPLATASAAISSDAARATASWRSSWSTGMTS